MNYDVSEISTTKAFSILSGVKSNIEVGLGFRQRRSILYNHWIDWQDCRVRDAVLHGWAP